MSNLIKGVVGLAIAVRVVKKVGAFTDSLVQKVKVNDNGGKIKW